MPTDRTAADIDADADPDVDRVRAAVATIPFLLVGAFNVLLVVLWGVEYLWGFVVFVPVVFMSALAWVAFKANP